MKKIKNFFKNLAVNIIDDNLGDYSAQCAYYIFLSFAPFLLLLISLIKYFNMSQELIYYILNLVIPINIEKTFINIIEEISNKSVAITIVPIIAILWVARKGVYSLTKGLRFIFKIENKRAMYIKLTINSIIHTIEFLSFILGSLVLIIFGSNITNEIYKIFNNTPVLGIVINVAKSIIIFLTFFLFFIFIYTEMPTHKVTVISQIPGSIFAVIGWMSTSKLVSLYFEIFKNSTTKYGSLTSSFLILIWIYISVYIIFLGAEINKTINKKTNIILENL